MPDRRPRPAFLPSLPLAPLQSPPPRPTQRPRTFSTPPRAAAATPEAKARYVARVRASLDERCVGSDCPFWAAMQAEAREAAAEEPLLASFMFATILNHRSLPSALAFHLASKLESPAIPATQLMRLFGECLAGGVDGGVTVQRDILAVMERDPACTRFIDCLCYYKGFHALQVHRIAHKMWNEGRMAVAYHLQAQVSKELQVDIHPAASIGAGAFFDHATGVVIGETCVIGEDVSMLHHVTLGGSGKKHGQRHPRVGNGVLIGAGATLLGNLWVGDGAQIGACSLVLEDIAEGTTVVGVPAKAVGKARARKVVPALEMKHERCLEGAACLEEEDDECREVRVRNGWNGLNGAKVAGSVAERNGSGNSW